MPIVIAVVLIIILAAVIVKTLAPPNTIAGKIASTVLSVAPAVGGAVGVPGLGGLTGGASPTSTASIPLSADRVAALKGCGMTDAQIANLSPGQSAQFASMTAAQISAACAPPAPPTVPAARNPLLTLAVVGLAIFLVFTLLLSDPKKK